MIRIYTRFPDNKRVATIFFQNSWVTMGSGMEVMAADNLFDAGKNHLQMACALREKLKL